MYNIRTSNRFKHDKTVVGLFNRMYNMHTLAVSTKVIHIQINSYENFEEKND